jgi:hypothetical protein
MPRTLVVIVINGFAASQWRIFQDANVRRNYHSHRGEARSADERAQRARHGGEPGRGVTPQAERSQQHA